MKASCTILLSLLLLSACAMNPQLKQNNPNSTQANLDVIAKSQEKLNKNPRDQQARIDLENARYRQTNKKFDEVELAFKAGNVESARAVLNEILMMDPANQRVQDVLRKMETNARHDEALVEIQKLLDDNKTDVARIKLRNILIENPNQKEARALIKSLDAKVAKDQITPRKLKPTGNGTVTLDFRDANLRNVFEVISKTSGINFILDPTVRADLKTSVFVKDAAVTEVIDFLLLMHQLNKKVLTDNSVLVYPENKASQYEDLVLRSFYLNNADAKQTVSLIRTMLPIKDVFVDEKLNMFSVKATFEQLRDIERLIADEDLPDPEVLLDVEVLEVKRSKLTDIGMAFPDTFSVLSSTSTSSTSTTLTAADFESIRAKGIGISPTLALKLLRQDNDSNLLANPRIRVKNREKAKIHIGDKIPITTTTVGSNSNFAATSANYLDVGLKLDVEPRVLLNSDVSIKISLEVSNASFPTGATFPTIGTRNTSTVLMTGDGETQVLAGLISDEDRKNTRRLPGLGDLPVLGRLFSEPNDTNTKTEIVLLITPHVVRNLMRPEAADTEFYGGTATKSGSPANINPAATLQQMSPQATTSNTSASNTPQSTMGQPNTPNQNSTLSITPSTSTSGFNPKDD